MRGHEGVLRHETGAANWKSSMQTPDFKCSSSKHKEKNVAVT